jgi:hypothetical protein
MAVEFKKTDEFYQFTHISPKNNKYTGLIPSIVFPQLKTGFWEGHEKFTGLLANQTPNICYQKMYINKIFCWSAKLTYHQILVHNTTSGDRRVIEYTIYLFSEQIEPFITHCIKWI